MIQKSLHGLVVNQKLITYFSKKNIKHILQTQTSEKETKITAVIPLAHNSSL